MNSLDRHIEEIIIEEALEHYDRLKYGWPLKLTFTFLNWCEQMNSQIENGLPDEFFQEDYMEICDILKTIFDLEHEVAKSHITIFFKNKKYLDHEYHK